MRFYRLFGDRPANNQGPSHGFVRNGANIMWIMNPFLAMVEKGRNASKEKEIVIVYRDATDASIALAVKSLDTAVEELKAYKQILERSAEL